MIHAALGEHDAALSAWRKVEEWTPLYISILRDLYPEALGPIRDEPGFRELLREVHRYWGVEPDGSIPAGDD